MFFVTNFTTSEPNRLGIPAMRAPSVERRLLLLSALLLSSDSTGSGTNAMEMQAPSSRINSTISAVFSKQRQLGPGPRGRGNDSMVGRNAASEKSGAVSGKQVLGTNSTKQAPAAAERQHEAGGGAKAPPTTTIAQHAHLPNAPSRFGYPTLTKGHYLQNITVMHEKISAPKGSGGRWDSGGGQALDKALKDDGPKQLQTAIMVLVTVAGSFICGGAAIVACCWRGREKGWSSAAKQENREKFKGSGAQWLEMDC